MFSIHELVKASSGKLIRGKADARVTNVSIDTRTLRPGDCFIAIKGENFDGHDFIPEAVRKGAGCIIQERKAGAKGLSLPAVIEAKDTIKALGLIAGFHRRRFTIPVIAVTGSNGKTTTKEMIAWILSGSSSVLKNEGTRNNHIGLPLTLLKLSAQHQFAVVELGTNHFGEIKYLADIAKPNIAVITNIGPSHLEYLKDTNGVFKEKISLLRFLQAPGLCVLNADDALLKKEIGRKNNAAFILGTSVTGKAEFTAGNINHYNGRLEFTVNKVHLFSLKTFGRYNVYNGLAAVALGRVFGMSYKEIAGRLECFDFPAGRLNFRENRRIKFIDDTYNSNPLSLGHALDVLERFDTAGRRILVIGDMLELGPLSESFHLAAGSRAAQVCDVCIAVGELSRHIAEALRERGFDLENLFTCENSGQAREILLEKVGVGQEDIVLVKGSRAMRMEEVFKV